MPKIGLAAHNHHQLLLIAHGGHRPHGHAPQGAPGRHHRGRERGEDRPAGRQQEPDQELREDKEEQPEPEKIKFSSGETVKEVTEARYLGCMLNDEANAAKEINKTPVSLFENNIFFKVFI